MSQAQNPRHFKTSNTIKKSFNDHVYFMLMNRPRTLTFEQLAEEAGVSVHWLRAYSRGKSVPNVHYVQTLYEYLAKKPLQF